MARPGSVKSGWHLKLQESDTSMTLRIPLTDVVLDEKEFDAVRKVLESRWLTMGREVLAFEDAFAETLGAKHAIAVTNGTMALQLAYQASGLGPDDEFIVPALTFAATMNAGLALGARAVLVDCTSEDDLTLCPEDLARKISPRTKLVVPMAYGGHCPAMNEICSLCEEHGIAIVEDACHAPLASLDDRKIGTFGLAGAFSFFGNKNLTTGEGGMIVTNDDDLNAQLRLLRSHGMSSMTWERHQQLAHGYDVSMVGYNARMDEMHAALGRVQLERLPELTRLRTENAHKLRRSLSNIDVDGFRIPFENPRGIPAHHLCVILLPEGMERARFRELLYEAGVQTSIHYTPLHQLSLAETLWADTRPVLPVVDAIADRLVTLPLGPTLSDEDIAWIATTTEQALKAFA